MSNLSFLPSLKYMALVRIAGELWTNEDNGLLRKMTDNLSNRYVKEDEYFKNSLMHTAQSLLEYIPLPSKNKEEIMPIISNLGWQILQWKYYHKQIIGKDSTQNNLKKICFSSNGRIDRKKTAELLVKDINLTVDQRFNLACIYCLESEIDTLLKHIVITEFKILEDIKLLKFPLRYCWLIIKAKDIATLDQSTKDLCLTLKQTYIQLAFSCSIDNNNEVAAKYFYQILAERQNPDNLVLLILEAFHQIPFGTVIVPQEYRRDLFLFLISTLNIEQRMILFNDTYFQFNALTSFMKWPWLDLNKNLLHDMLDFIREYDYDKIFKVLIEKYTWPNLYYNEYLDIFEYYLKNAPEELKRSYLHFSSICRTFNLFDYNIIATVFKYATDAEKSEFVNSEIGLQHLYFIITNKKWHLLEIFVRKCILTKNQMLEFKSKIITYCNKDYYKKDATFDKLCCVLNKLYLEYDEK